VAASAQARNEQEMIKVLSKLKAPYAMKIADPDVVHKTEVGGVMLDINSEKEAIEAFQSMKLKLQRPHSEFGGVMIQEMIEDGVETIIGMNCDPSVGPLIMFGLGGVNVEVMNDVAFKVNPLTAFDADELIRSVKGYRLLTGFRGAPTIDLDDLKEAILRLSQLVIDFPEFTSIDINPFMASHEKCRSVAVDARLSL
jgi:acyl-CoA synthetase (NDP forming)